MSRFYIHKLGCPKNDVDADYIAGYLIKHNCQAVLSPEDADILIINSCGFIQSAKEESINSVLELGQLKKKRPETKLVITGCLAQRYAEQLKEEIPELDGIFGIDDFRKIIDLIKPDGKRVTDVQPNQPKYREYDFDRVVDSDQVFAYLKISDGCDNRCSYCSIPDIRGQFRSRTIESIIGEARYLLELGKKEIILVSQETTAYGRDLYGKPQLIKLLDEFEKIPGEFWIRVMYLHPARLQTDMIDYMIDNPRICNYFDLPLQHINNDILKAMGRQVGQKEIEKLLNYIRNRSQSCAIRTNFIVGFPGETEAQFEQLYSFVESQRFDRMGSFEYSAEEATKAAEMANQIDDQTCQARYHRLMELQRDIAFEKNEAKIGNLVRVLVETVSESDNISVGRTAFDAPEVDQSVTIKGYRATPGSFTPTPGDFVSVRVTGCDGYDLLAERELS